MTGFFVFFMHEVINDALLRTDFRKTSGILQMNLDWRLAKLQEGVGHV
jgi:hypothetical protein